MFKIFTFDKTHIKTNLDNFIKEILYKTILNQIIIKTKLNSYAFLEIWSSIFDEQIKTDYQKNKVRYLSTIFKALTHSPTESVINNQGQCLVTSKRHREFLLKTQESHILNNGQELVLLNLTKICFPALSSSNKSLYIFKKEEYFDLINTIFSH